MWWSDWLCCFHATSWGAAHDCGAFIETGNIEPWMHPATLASKIARSAPNWEQLLGSLLRKSIGDSASCFLNKTIFPRFHQQKICRFSYLLYATEVFFLPKLQPFLLGLHCLFALQSPPEIHRKKHSYHRMIATLLPLEVK